MDSVRIFCPGCSQVMEVKAPYANVVCPRCQMMILFKEEDIIQIQCDCGKLFSISYKYADREAICNDCSRKLFIPKFILDFSSSESSFQTEINEPLQFEKEVKIPLQFETDTNVPLQFEDEITTKNESIQPITIKNMSVESEEELIFGECQSVLNLWDDRILPTSIDLEFHQPIVPKSHEIVQYEENLSLLQSPNLPSNFLQIQENILFLFQKPIFFIPFLFFVVFLFYIVVSPVPKKNLHKNPKKVSYNLETNHIPWVE
jgi:DNA-directed RNA polymerase subunit RPC12/RpoP